MQRIKKEIWEEREREEKGENQEKLEGEIYFIQ